MFGNGIKWGEKEDKNSWKGERGRKKEKNVWKGREIKKKGENAWLKGKNKRNHGWEWIERKKEWKECLGKEIKKQERRYKSLWRRRMNINEKNRNNYRLKTNNKEELSWKNEYK